MKKNLKYLIIGATALASTVIVVAPIVAASKYIYPGDPIAKVEADVKSIKAVEFKQDTYKYNTSFNDLKQLLFDGNKVKTDAISHFNFFTKDGNEFQLASFTDAKPKLFDIVANDNSQSFDVYFVIESTKPNSLGKLVDSSVVKSTVSFGYKPEFDLTSFAHEVRQGFTGENPTNQNQAALTPFTIKNFSSSDTEQITELTSVQSFVNDLNSSTSSDDAKTKLGKYFDIKSIFSSIDSNKDNQIAGQTSTKRYVVNLTTNPNTNSKEYVTFSADGKKVLIYLQTQFSDVMKKDFAGLQGIDAKHIDILEIPVENVFANSSLASQFDFQQLQQKDYYKTGSNVANLKLDLSQTNPLDWIFAYKSAFFPNKAYKNEYALSFINATLNQDLSLYNFSWGKFNNPAKSNNAEVAKDLAKLTSEVSVDGDTLLLSYDKASQKIVATADATITVKRDGQVLFSKPFVITLNDFNQTKDSQLKGLFVDEKSNQNQFFRKDEKLNSGVSEQLSYNAVDDALKSKNPDDIKNVFADPNALNVQFYTGERLEALTKEFKLPTAQQIKQDFYTSPQKSTHKSDEGVFNIQSNYLPTDLSVTRYYFALANQGLDVAAKQFLQILEAAKLVQNNSTLDVNKPIFEQLKNIKLTNPLGIDKEMKFFSINHETQEYGVNSFQSVLVNSKDDSAYKLIKNYPNSDALVLQNIFEKDTDKLLDNIYFAKTSEQDQIDNSKFVKFENVAQLLISMYNKIQLLSRVGIGFPLLPIAKNLQFSYGIQGPEGGLKEQKSVQLGTLQPPQQPQPPVQLAINNFTYQYELNFIDDKGNKLKDLYQGEKDAELLKNIKLTSKVDKDVEKLNSVVESIPQVYRTIRLNNNIYFKEVNKLFDGITDTNTVQRETLDKLGLVSLYDYLFRVDPTIKLTIDKKLSKDIIDPSGLRSYKAVTLFLIKNNKKSTTPLRIFVYLRQGSN